MQALHAQGRVVVDIEKRLPVQGGLGGASANAVAALLGLERVLKKSLPAAERVRIAAEVGSDLPLFLVGGMVLGVGRGEQVYPLEDLPATACVVVTPEVGVSTPKLLRRGIGCMGAGTPAREAAPEAHAPGKVEGSEPAGLCPARTLRLRSGQARKSARPHMSGGESSDAKLTLPAASDRMVELGRGLSAWLSEITPVLLLEGAGPRIRFSRLSGPGSRTTLNRSSFLSIPS